MKTLYININGEDIQSNADRHVVGRPEDALINAFYYELGNEILNGVPGVSIISKRDLVLEFKTHYKDRFDKILDQWTALKKIVLGPNPSGQFGVELPDEYVKWLQDKSDRVYRAIAMSLVNRERKVNISIDNIYEAIELLLDSIDPDDCSDCEQFVVNDELITAESRIVIDFMDSIGHRIPFVPFKDWHEANQDELNAESEEHRNDPEQNEAQVFFIAINGQTPFEIRKLSVISLKNKLYSHESTHGFLSYSLGVDDHNPYIDVHDGWSYDFFERLWLHDGSIVEGSNLSFNKNDIDRIFRIDHNRIEEEIRLFLESHPEYNDDENNIIVPDYDETYLPRYENFIWGFHNSGEDVIDFWELQISNNFKFEYLFKLKTRASWCRAKVLPSGLIAIRRIIDELNNTAWGIVDRTGIYILPSKYDFTPSKEVSTCPFEEIQPRIIKKGYTNDNSHWECLNIDKREVYDKVYNDFFVKEVADFEGNPVAQLFDKNSFNLLFCIDNCNAGFADLSNGWYLVQNYKTLNPILISKNSYFELSTLHEKVYDNIEAHALINAHNLDYKPFFISEDRIITCVPKSGIGLRSISRIKIYSYSGDLIKEYDIKDNPLLIKQPYKFGKALCFKISANGKSADLYYLDLDGNEHAIPYKGGHRIKSYTETEVFLVSKDTFVINNKEDGFRSELRNLNGDVLFKNASWILPFSGQYLAYYSSKSGREYGIIDYKGNIIIEPEHDSFELVECSNGVYKHYNMYGNCEELSE